MKSMKLELVRFEMGRNNRPIARLISGKIVLPCSGFVPNFGEEWWVYIEERDRFAIAYPVVKWNEEEKLLPNLPKCKLCNRPVVIYKTLQWEILYHRLWSLRNSPQDLYDKVGVAYDSVFRRYELCSDCVPKCSNCNSPLNTSSLCRLPAEYPRSNPQLCCQCFPFTEKCSECGSDVVYRTYTVPYETPVAHFECSKCGNRQSVNVGWRLVERLEGRKII